MQRYFSYFNSKTEIPLYLVKKCLKQGVASSGQFVIETDVKSRENKEVDEDSKIQCFQTPHSGNSIKHGDMYLYIIYLLHQYTYKALW